MSLGKAVGMACPGAIRSVQPLPHTQMQDGVPSTARGPSAPAPAHPHREESQTSLPPGEAEVNRSVGLTKDPGELGKRGDPG